MAEWIDRYGPGNREDVQIIEQAEGWFALHGWSRFIDITAPDDREPNVPNCAGSRKREPGGRVVWLVSPSVLRDEIARGHDPANTARVYARFGMPEAGSGSKATSVHGNLGYMLRCVSTNSWLSSDLGQKPKPHMRRKKV
ncbi:hypothetical protein [Laribacter hongkongensis]|uniref:hypothetical protein n=1 Tax=Laribacter hongkongensis TaxID=168471 RepID=UPI0005A224B7|nr:hypothetical protein [Laribacter hongkongensis]